MASLPPAGDPVVYAAGSAGREGPMTREQLAERVADGRLDAGALVWWPGLDDWIPFDEHPELGRPAGAARQAPVSERPEASPDGLDAEFARLVEASWRHHHLLEDARRVDEVLVGGIVVAALDGGRVLIDLSSDGTSHFLRFEDPQDRSRVSMAITHLTRDATTARALGQRAALTVAYGEAITRFAEVVQAMRKQVASGYVEAEEPGIVSFHEDEASHYLYAQVDLVLDVDEYVSDRFAVDYEGLTLAVGACVHALRRLLRGRAEEDA